MGAPSIECSRPLTSADLPYGTVMEHWVPAGSFPRGCFAARRFRTLARHFLERRHLAETLCVLRCFAFGLTTPASICVLNRNGAVRTSTPPSRRWLETVSFPATSRAFAWNSYAPGLRFESSTC